MEVSEEDLSYVVVSESKEEEVLLEGQYDLEVDLGSRVVVLAAVDNLCRQADKNLRGIKNMLCQIYHRQRRKITQSYLEQ